MKKQDIRIPASIVAISGIFVCVQAIPRHNWLAAAWAAMCAVWALVAYAASPD